MEDGSAGAELPTKQDEEFRPFIRRLPEFKFWYAATRALTIGFLATWFDVFNIPVFWPVLVVYWLILFTLTSTYRAISSEDGDATKLTLFPSSAETDPTYDQVSLRTFFLWQGPVQQEW